VDVLPFYGLPDERNEGELSERSERIHASTPCLIRSAEAKRRQPSTGRAKRGRVERAQRANPRLAFYGLPDERSEGE
jgi:hypothetical protein